MDDQSDFFIAGGTLRSQTPSYVTRPADQELLDSVLAGNFCYVLTSRQMGKSSLMVRTARRLKEAGVAPVVVDLTNIGTVPIDMWYLGLLTRVKTDLRLAADVEAWWNERQALGATQRFIEFLRDVVLAETTIPIVIFIDEIDSTLNLPFRDDFFAAIRAMYNARATEPAYNRLTFVLLGVATPTDLIQDRERTPFNIGRRIVLKELSYTDAEPLRNGLEASHAGQVDRLLTRIFYWTNGHPYLTQKLCLAATLSPVDAWDDTKVDELVDSNFFSKEARKDTNLTFVQDCIRASLPADRRRMLKLYRRVYGEKPVPEDDRSPIQNHLELFGLVGVQQGRLGVRNQIYRRVFDQDWIKANTPANTPLTVAIIAGIVTLLLAAFSAYRILNPPTQAAVAAEVCIQNFENNTSPAVRLDALACLFERTGYQERALTLFYNGLSQAEQKYLFLSANPQAGHQVVTVIKGVYVTLDDQMPNDHEIMDTMIEALEQAQQPGTNQLIAEITGWEKGRELAEKGQYQDAFDIYNKMLPLNNNNPAAHYDRAIVALALRRHGAALADLDEVVRIARAAQTASQSTAQANPPTAAPSRFIDASHIIAAVRETIRGDEQLQTTLLENLATYPSLAAAANEIVQAERATQTVQAEEIQAALAAQATGTAVAVAETASVPSPTPVPPTPTPVPPTPTPVPPTPTPTPDASATAQADQRCFPETGQCISGRIRQFWEQNGGLPIFGLPITAQQPETIEGKTFQVQWFERNLLELHPENAHPFDVLLGRVGADLLARQGRDPFTFPKSQPQPGCRYFPETEHNICGDFLKAWHAHGLEFDGRPGKSEAENLALFGLPLSDAMIETLYGEQRTVQWFERARLELYPENAPPYNVLLGHLGSEILHK